MDHLTKQLSTVQAVKTITSRADSTSLIFLSTKILYQSESPTQWSVHAAACIDEVNLLLALGEVVCEQGTSAMLQCQPHKCIFCPLNCLYG